MTEKLFAVLLGGRAPGCHIELHDVVFTVGDSIEQTYPKLVKKWFGSSKGLHIDSYVELSYVDGHQLTVSKQANPNNNNLKLFFINFGGYKPNFFGEIHETGFYVGKDKNEALRRARHDLCVGSVLQHRDDVLVVGEKVEKEVDDILELNTLDGYYIHFTPLEKPSSPKIVSDFIKIEAFAE